jgi:hypothetical protein
VRPAAARVCCRFFAGALRISKKSYRNFIEKIQSKKESYRNFSEFSSKKKIILKFYRKNIEKILSKSAVNIFEIVVVKFIEFARCSGLALVGLCEFGLVSGTLGTVNLVLASALATCDKRIEKSEKTDLKNMIDRRQRQPAARAPSAAHLRPKNSLASAKNANVFKGKIKHKTQKRPCKPQSALAKRLAAGTRRRAIPIAAASHLRPIDRPKTSIKCENFYENFIKIFCKSWKFLADFRAPSGPRLSSF